MRRLLVSILSLMLIGSLSAGISPQFSATQKPAFESGYRLNPNHPLNKGLVSSFLFNTTSNVQIDLNNKYTASLTGSWMSRKWLALVNQAAINNYALLSANPLTLSNSFSVHILAYPTSLTQVGNADGTYLMLYNDDVNTSLRIANSIVTSYFIECVLTIGGVEKINTRYSDVAPVLNKWYDIVVSYNETTVSVYVNGLLMKNGFSAQMSYTASNMIAARSATLGNIGANISIVEFYNRALSEFEAKQLCLNPLGAPDNPRLLFPGGFHNYYPSGGFKPFWTSPNSIIGGGL
jgi:hypothetical protein